MTNLRKIILGAVSLAALAAANGASAQANTKTATGSVEVLSPISLANPRGLDFGRVIKNGSGAASVDLAATDAGDTSNASGLTLASTGNPRSSAKFVVSGADGYTFAITGGTGDVALTSSVANATSGLKITLARSAGTGTIGAASGTFYVGGTLSLPAVAVTPGAYSGTFDVSVDYN